MKISTKSEYALRALLELALENSPKPISLKEVCSKQKLPLKFIEQLFRKLKKVDLVKSVQGPKGGYYLSKPIDEISLNQILIALEDDFFTKPCTHKTVQYCSGKNCSIIPVLDKIEKDMTTYFSEITLASILNSEN